ncbi:PGSIP6 [Symbiodinium sp. CCMP2592]|nr:PGSIP6 [Symbiodinium sp. CCMP2592]
MPIPGYTGHLRAHKVENVFGATFGEAMVVAQAARSRRGADEDYAAHSASRSHNFDGGSLNTTKGHKLGKDEPYAKAAKGTGSNGGALSEGLGCCFSIGFGAGMQPCCLKTERLVTFGSCRVGRRIGGLTGFAVGHCPRSAREAASMVDRQGLVVTPEFLLTEGGPLRKEDPLQSSVSPDLTAVCTAVFLIFILVVMRFSANLRRLGQSRLHRPSEPLLDEVSQI